MTHKSWKLAGGAVGVLCLVFVCLWGVVSSQSFMSMAAEQAGAIATEALDTRISLGNVEVKSWRELQVDGIDIYDKRQQLLAHADEAVIRLSPLAMLQKSAAEGISSIDINRADVTIVQREDGTWNFADLVSEEKSDTRFTARINVADSTLRSRYNNQDIVLEHVNGYADMASYPSVSLKASCENNGASAQLSATVDTDNGARQTFQLSLQNAELANYMPYLPAGWRACRLPENVWARSFIITDRRSWLMAALFCWEKTRWKRQRPLLPSTKGRPVFLPVRKPGDSRQLPMAGLL